MTVNTTFGVDQAPLIEQAMRLEFGRPPQSVPPQQTPRATIGVRLAR